MHRYPIIISIDPGNTTGVAAVSMIPNPDDEHERVFPLGHNAAEIPGGIDGFSKWFASISPQLLDHYGDQTWLVERFTITKRTIATKVDYHALYIIGFLAAMNGLDNLVFRMPGQRRVAHGRLPSDWDNPTKDDHANDASEHLAVYLTEQFPYLTEHLLMEKGS